LYEVNNDAFIYYIPFCDGYFKLECDYFHANGNIIIVKNYPDNSSFDKEDNFLMFYLHKEIISLLVENELKNTKRTRLA